MTLNVYKLKKTYPGGPTIDSKVIETKTTGGRTTGYMLLSSIDKNLITYSQDYIENFPEFWEKEKASL